MYFPVKNRKIEYHCKLLHTYISLRLKFQLILTILNFWTKFTQKKWYFQLKTEQSDKGLQAFASCLVSVSSAVVFEHLEDLKYLLF